ncbi:hypothetical protein GCM10010245_47910 [Streptomyces spectabilis]|nr:hypothetical protein GCM10010245_47910 [Streptomyces spectabilis]
MAFHALLRIGRATRAATRGSDLAPPDPGVIPLLAAEFRSTADSTARRMSHRAPARPPAARSHVPLGPATERRKTMKRMPIRKAGPIRLTTACYYVCSEH